MGGRLARRPFAIAVALLATLVSVAAQAGSDPPSVLVRVVEAGPGDRTLYLLSGAGYGYTGAVLGIGDRHHRLAGTLAVDARLVPWLGLALRLDGRYDLHTAPSRPNDDGWVGDPRLYLRADHALAAGLRLGVRAGLWLPGRNAPSVRLGALSPELAAMLTAPVGGAVLVTLNAGYRLDRSAQSAPDAARMSPADRMALGVSAFDQVLLGALVAYRRGPWQGYLDADAELLVGSGSPSPLASPIRIGLGGRRQVSPTVWLETRLEVSPSARPDLGATAPLVPVPPRAAIWVGLAYRAVGPTASVPASAPSPGPAPELAPAPAPEVTPPPPGELHGKVTAADGGALNDLRVVIARAEERQVVPVDPGGHFSFVGAPGDIMVEAEAAGYTAAKAPATLSAGSSTPLAISLERRLPAGQLRGLVQSLAGVALDATIRIEPTGQELRANHGRFETDVAPGAYKVLISMPGYIPQKRTVLVEENGVTVLNVALTGAR
jgi:hypothetical protein